MNKIFSGIVVHNLNSTRKKDAKARQLLELRFSKTSLASGQDPGLSYQTQNNVIKQMKENIYKLSDVFLIHNAMFEGWCVVLEFAQRVLIQSMKLLDITHRIKRVEFNHLIQFQFGVKGCGCNRKSYVEMYIKTSVEQENTQRPGA